MPGVDRDEFLSIATSGKGSTSLDLVEGQGDVSAYVTRGGKTRIPAYSKIGLDIDKIKNSIKHVVIEQNEEKVTDSEGKVIDTTLTERKECVDNIDGLYTFVKGKEESWLESRKGLLKSGSSQTVPEKRQKDKSGSEQTCIRPQENESRSPESSQMRELSDSIQDLVQLFQNPVRTLSKGQDQFRESQADSPSQSTTTPSEKPEEPKKLEKTPELQDIVWETSVGSFSCRAVKVVKAEDFVIVVYLTGQKDRYIPNPSGESTIVLTYGDGSESVEVKSYGISFDLELQDISYTMVILVPYSAS